jgi:hypothetical protein
MFLVLHFFVSLDATWDCHVQVFLSLSLFCFHSHYRFFSLVCWLADFLVTLLAPWLTQGLQPPHHVNSAEGLGDFNIPVGGLTQYYEIFFVTLSSSGK